MPRVTIAQLQAQIAEEQRLREAAESRQALTPGETADRLRASEAELASLRNEYYAFQNDVHRAATAQAIRRNWCDEINPIMDHINLPPVGYVWEFEVKVAIKARNQEQALAWMQQLMESFPHHHQLEANAFTGERAPEGVLYTPGRNRGAVIISGVHERVAVPTPEVTPRVPADPGPEPQMESEGAQAGEGGDPMPGMPGLPVPGSIQEAVNASAYTRTPGYRAGGVQAGAFEPDINPNPFILT